MQMLCCHVGCSWFEPGGTIERRATAACQSSMPGTGPRVFLCDERINIPLVKMRLSVGFFKKKEVQIHLHPHITRSTELPVEHLPTSQVITSSHIWLLFKCFAIYIYILDSILCSESLQTLLPFVLHAALIAALMNWSLPALPLWRCVVNVEVFQPHRQPHPLGLLLSLLRICFSPPSDSSDHMFLPRSEACSQQNHRP